MSGDGLRRQIRDTVIRVDLLPGETGPRLGVLLQAPRPRQIQPFPRVLQRGIVDDQRWLVKNRDYSAPG